MNANYTADRLKALIIDDDIPSVEVLRDSLSRHPLIEECRCAYSLAKGSEEIESFRPDIIFLDMEFPDSNGLDWYLGASLPAGTKVIFYTAYQKYIHDAISRHVFDFLLKPFDAGEIEIILQRAANTPAEANQRGSSEALPAPRQAGRPIAITTITNDKIIAAPSDILYFRYDSERKLWECVLTSLKRYILKRQSTAETILNYGPDFIRTHKRFIINVNYLGLISNTDCTMLPPFDNISEIKISKSFRRDLLDRFYDI